MKLIKCPFCGSKETHIIGGFNHGLNVNCEHCNKHFSLKDKGVY